MVVLVILGPLLAAASGSAATGDFASAADWHQRGVDAFEAGNHRDAIMNLERANLLDLSTTTTSDGGVAGGEDPDEFMERLVLAHDYLSWSYHVTGQHQAALDHANTVLLFTPENTRVQQNVRAWSTEEGTRLLQNRHFKAGKAAFDHGEWATSIRYFALALSDAGPFPHGQPQYAMEHANIHGHISWAYGQLDRPRRAMAHAEAALHLDPGNDRLATNAADYRRQVGLDMRHGEPRPGDQDQTAQRGESAVGFGTVVGLREVSPPGQEGGVERSKIPEEEEEEEEEEKVEKAMSKSQRGGGAQDGNAPAIPTPPPPPRLPKAPPPPPPRSSPEEIVDMGGATEDENGMAEATGEALCTTADMCGGYGENEARHFSHAVRDRIARVDNLVASAGAGVGAVARQVHVDVGLPAVVADFLSPREVRQMRRIMAKYAPTGVEPRRTTWVLDEFNDLIHSMDHEDLALVDAVVDRIHKFVVGQVRANLTTVPDFDGRVWPETSALYRYNPGFMFRVHVDTDFPKRCLSTSVSLTTQGQDHAGGALFLHGCDTKGMRRAAGDHHRHGNRDGGAAEDSDTVTSTPLRDLQCRFANGAEWVEHMRSITTPSMFRLWDADPNAGSAPPIRRWMQGEALTFLPVLKAVPPRAGTLTVFLSENAHSVSQVADGTRDTFFLWLSCGRQRMVDVVNATRGRRPHT